MSTEQIGALGCAIGAAGCAMQGDMTGAAILAFAFLACAGLDFKRRNRRPKYIYGRVEMTIDNRLHVRENVRLNTSTGRVEFVLWKAGQQGHTEDYWHVMGEGWEKGFTAYGAEGRS